MQDNASPRAARPSDEVPFIMTKELIDENFMRLRYDMAQGATPKKTYLQLQVLQAKCIQELNVDRYVLNAKRLTPVQFYMNSTIRRTTYLTAQHFILGLERVDPGMGHIIKNLAHGVPLFVFLCAENKREKYDMHVGRAKALVNKTWIVEDFEQRSVEPDMFLPIPSNSVYFLFTVSHSEFVVERLDQVLPGSCEQAISSPWRDRNERLEETNACLLSKVDRLERRISEQAEENERLASENRELRLRIQSLEAEALRGNGRPQTPPADSPMEAMNYLRGSGPEIIEID